MKKAIIIFLLACMIALAGICAEYASAEKNEPQVVAELIPEPIAETTIAPEVQDPEYRYIQDCPLSKEVQQGIFDICERYNVAFELVMAVIQRESNFNAAAVGDHGDSVGLMQIQEKWHSELMEELGVTDLYDPLENVEVGVALLAQYFKEGKEVYYALMKYNGGGAYAKRMLKAGKVSKYALEITETAFMYERENGI